MSAGGLVPPQGCPRKQEEGAKGVTQQAGVEAQNVPVMAASMDVGEQLDCGWEPWGEGLSQG